jgi:hypothetical protein
VLDAISMAKTSCSGLIRTLRLIFFVLTETVGSYSLTLSYDIVKAHGGELKVETEEDKFAEFITLLPHTL